MNATGWQSASTVFSSSAEPWPDTCTGAMSWWSTVAPARVRAFTVSDTASSFPGTGFADMITRSPTGSRRRGGPERHARERGERLALRAGAQDRHLARREVGEPARLDQRALRDLRVAEVAGDVEVPHHRAADHADLAPAPLGGIDHLLQPVDVRGERGYDHPARRIAHDAAQRGGDDLLALGHTLALGVRRVGQQEREAVLAEPGELRQSVRWPSIGV